MSLGSPEFSEQPVSKLTLEGDFISSEDIAYMSGVLVSYHALIRDICSEEVQVPLRRLVDDLLPFVGHLTSKLNRLPRNTKLDDYFLDRMVSFFGILVAGTTQHDSPEVTAFLNALHRAPDGFSVLRDAQPFEHDECVLLRADHPRMYYNMAFYSLKKALYTNNRQLNHMAALYSKQSNFIARNLYRSDAVMSPLDTLEYRHLVLGNLMVRYCARRGGGTTPKDQIQDLWEMYHECREYLKAFPGMYQKYEVRLLDLRQEIYGLREEGSAFATMEYRVYKLLQIFLRQLLAENPEALDEEQERA